MLVSDPNRVSMITLYIVESVLDVMIVVYGLLLIFSDVFSVTGNELFQGWIFLIFSDILMRTNMAMILVEITTK